MLRARTVKILLQQYRHEAAHEESGAEDSGGTQALSTLTVFSVTSSTSARFFAFLPAITMLDLSTMLSARACPPERLGPFSGSSGPLQRTVHIPKASQ